MKYYELTKEEQQILKDYESGLYSDVSDFEKQKNYYQKLAQNTLKKTRNINIRLSETTLSRLKAKAASQGIPYQTFASSILHRFVTR